MNRAERRRQRSKAGKLAKSTSSTPTILSSAEHQLVTIGHQTHSIPEALSLAGEHHNAGRLPQAESIYQKILQIDPAQPIALHLLGVLAYQVGNNDVAIDLTKKSLAIEPDYVEAHNNLGNALKKLGKLDEAIACYQKSIEIRPAFAEAHNNLGFTLQEQCKLDDAVAR